jgi:hypothetical protein
MKKIGAAVVVIAVVAAGVTTVRLPGLRTQPLSAESQRTNGNDEIRTIDHFVPHISTALANRGELAHLFVRERVREGHHHPTHVVLMVQGATTPTVPIFDLGFQDYNWMEFLARAGFDAFAMDLQGYGLSTRPRMDDPCNTQMSQQALLIPFPLSGPCAPSYPFKMAIQSDWDDIDAVVEYLRRYRDVEKVDLVSWSRGGPRTGGYAALHPHKVRRMVLYSPAVYDRVGPSDPPPCPNQAF